MPLSSGFLFYPTYTMQTDIVGGYKRSLPQTKGSFTPNVTPCRAVPRTIGAKEPYTRAELQHSRVFPLLLMSPEMLQPKIFEILNARIL